MISLTANWALATRAHTLSLSTADHHHTLCLLLLTSLLIPQISSDFPASWSASAVDRWALGRCRLSRSGSNGREVDNVSPGCRAAEHKRRRRRTLLSKLLHYEEWNVSPIPVGQQTREKKRNVSQNRDYLKLAKSQSPNFSFFFEYALVVDGTAAAKNYV